MTQRLGPLPGRFESMWWRSLHRRESPRRHGQRRERLSHSNGLRDPPGKAGLEKTFRVVAQTDRRGDKQTSATFPRASFEDLLQLLPALGPQSMVQNHELIGHSLQSHQGVVYRRDSCPRGGLTSGAITSQAIIEDGG